MQLQTTARPNATMTPAILRQADPATCPFAMAQHLRMTEPAAARCFAQAMHDDAAWANETWGAFWADVLRLVS